MHTEYRLDELARNADVASTTVRLYQSKGLLPPPRLEGRTGWYDESHLARLRLIARLQDDGHSLAGIADLLDQWEKGRSLDAVIGVEAGIASLLGESHAITLDAADLLGRFPPGSMTTELMQRAAALGLIAAADEGRVRVADRRFLDSGAALAAMGIPLDEILDEWEALVDHTDQIAQRFVGIFETHLAPRDWKRSLDADQTQGLATTLVQLQSTARQVLGAALDASVARLTRDQLADLLP